MRSAWLALVLATAVGAIVIACSSFASDPDEPSLEAGADGAQDSAAASDAPTGDGGAGGDGCAAVNVMTDPLNCGACGHSCLGGACKAGMCQAVRFTATQNNIVSLAVTSAGVHWVTDGTKVLTCPPSGCPDAGPGVLAGGLSSITEILGFGDRVAIAATSEVHVYAQGNITRVKQNLNNARSLASEGPQGFLFVGDEGAKSVYRYDVGGMVRPFYANSRASDCAANGKRVYTYLGGNQEDIEGCDLPDCGVRDNLITGAPATVSVAQLAVNGKALFWLRPASRSILSCARGGCATPSVVATSPEPNALAVDDSYLYFTTGTGRTVERCPQTGCFGAGNQVQLAKGSPSHSPVLYEKALYWATDNDSPNPAAIWRIAR